MSNIKKKAAQKTMMQILTCIILFLGYFCWMFVLFDLFGKYGYLIFPFLFVLWFLFKGAKWLYKRNVRILNANS